LQVDLYENGTIAIAEAVSPELGNRVQRVRVQLPGTSQELLNKFREKKVDFAAHSNTEDGGAVFLNLLGAHTMVHDPSIAVIRSVMTCPCVTCVWDWVLSLLVGDVFAALFSKVFCRGPAPRMCLLFELKGQVTF
jgi:hypothetical protein